MDENLLNMIKQLIAEIDNRLMEQELEEHIKKLGCDGNCDKCPEYDKLKGQALTVIFIDEVMDEPPAREHEDEVFLRAMGIRP